MYRSYGVLRYAKILSTADALMQYAQLKLGHDHGMVTLSQEPDLYGQLVKVQPANIQKLYGRSLGLEERWQYRAEYFNRLMECERGIG